MKLEHAVAVYEKRPIPLGDDAWFTDQALVELRFLVDNDHTVYTTAASARTAISTALIARMNTLFPQVTHYRYRFSQKHAPRTMCWGVRLRSRDGTNATAKQLACELSVLYIHGISFGCRRYAYWLTVWHYARYQPTDWVERRQRAVASGITDVELVALLALDELQARDARTGCSRAFQMNVVGRTLVQALLSPSA